MSICLADYSDNIVSAIQELRKNQIGVDFCFISLDGRERFPVHKLVLGIQSPILSKLVYGDPMCNEIKVENVETIALQNMIKYLYSEDLIFEGISQIKQTKALADLYELCELGEICKAKFNEVQINVSNVLAALEVAKELESETKQEECLLIIGENQETVLTSQQFFSMQFEYALDVYEKLRKRKMITEYLFLRSAIRWIEINNMKPKKNLLMEKIDLHLLSIDQFLDVIEVQPEFFSNIEIANATKTIRHANGAQNVMLVRENNEESVDSTVAADRNENNEENSDRNSEPEDLQNGISENISGSSAVDNKTSNLGQQVGCERQMFFIEDWWQDKPSTLRIKILKQDDGVNPFNKEKRVKITIDDNICVRSMQIGLTDVLNQGLLRTIAEENKDFVSMNADISYRGLHFMLNCIPTLDPMLTPRQYISVLKAAAVFKFSDLEEQCRVQIRSIIDTWYHYDPLFLDDLMRLPHFKDKCLQLLKSKPLKVILHPNFIECSADLIIMLLEQDELHVVDESQLLLVVIPWLEAKNRDRRHFRRTILSKLAFKNISIPDFRYIIQCYPNFFSPEEQKLILAYRNATSSEVRFFRDKLPEWYTSKSRRILK